MLTVSPETVCRIVLKAREFVVKSGPGESDPGSNPTDDGEVAVLTDYVGDPAYDELAEAIVDLNEDEQIDLIALTWLGRGDFDDFKTARQQVESVRGRNMPDYLIGIPLLPSYLEDGLAELGHSCQSYDAEV